MIDAASRDIAVRRQCARWLALAAAALGASALAAIVLVLARTPVLSSAGVASHFSAALILHVELATLVWFLAFSMALATAMTRAEGGRIDALAFLLALAGFGAVFVSPIFAPAPPLLSNYFPVSNSAWFVGGLLLFVAAVLLAFGRLVFGLWRRRDAVDRVLVWTILPLLLAAVSLVWSLLNQRADDPGVAHEIVSWAPGHLIQFFFVGMMMLAWLHLATSLGWRSAERTGLETAFALLALPSLLALPIGYAFTPDSPEFRKAFTVLMAAATWGGPAWLLVRWRANLFARAAGASPAVAALRGSILLFLAGCLLGAVIRADNTLVPAHYHGTVGAVTLAFIGVALSLLGDTGRDRLCRAVVWLYGAGFTLMVASLAWTGMHGAPRKTPYAAPASEALGYSAAMAVHGIGGLLAVGATLLFAWTVLRALRGGARPELGERLGVAGEGRPVADRRDVRRRAIAIALLGTLAIGAVIAALTQQAALRAGTTALLLRVPAIDRLSHVTERKRKEVAVRFEQGVAMLRAGQYEYAMTAFHRILQLEPKMPEAHANLGYALIGVNEYAAARDFFLSALALRSNQANAYYGLAIAYEGLGDFELALGAMRTFVHLAAEDDPYRIRAESAVWEWENKLAIARGEMPPLPTPGKAPGKAGK